EGHQQHLHESRLDGAQGSRLSDCLGTAGPEGDSRIVHAQGALCRRATSATGRRVATVRPAILQGIYLAISGQGSPVTARASGRWLSCRPGTGPLVSSSWRLRKCRRDREADPGGDRWAGERLGPCAVAGSGRRTCRRLAVTQGGRGPVPGKATQEQASLKETSAHDEDSVHGTHF